ncbi:MAG: hypothetical protein HUU35_10975, partial [Armatimonadetes bacterium]|nr:hypothetical protein [Armatimonadota bacterium]
MPRPVWLLALALCLLPAVAQDLDGDGLTAAQEEALGADPRVADEFVSLLTDKAGDSPDPRRDVLQVEQASVGGNRYVWRVTFAEEFDPNTILHLYFDADGDLKSGRQNSTGTEYMLTHASRQARTTVYAADGGSLPSVPARLVIDGKRLYLGAEFDLKQVDGRSRYRLFVLCERLDPHVAVDSIAWAAVEGPGVSPRAKVRLDSDIAATEGFRPLRGLQTIFGLKADPSNRAISIREAKLEGFGEDITTEYRGISTLRTGADGSTVTFPITSPGRWYLGVQLYDGPGAEKVRVQLNGQRLGYLVATSDPKDLVLFSSEKPYDLKAGDSLELKALTSDGLYRIEELLLLKAAPPAWQPKFEISHLQATEVAEGTRVTFMTSWPVAATVELTRGGQTATVTEDRLLQNHRVWFARPDASAGQARVVVKAARADGSLLTTPPALVQAAYAEIERRTGSAKREAVPLKLLNAEV